MNEVDRLLAAPPGHIDQAREREKFRAAFAELARCLLVAAVGGRRMERLAIQDTWMVMEPGAKYQKRGGTRPGTRSVGKCSPGGSRAERRKNLSLARRLTRRPIPTPFQESIAALRSMRKDHG